MRLAPIVFTLTLFGAHAASAQGIISEWSSVTAPPAPKLEHVTLEPQTTALLMLDVATQTCGTPRCHAMLPGVAKLLAMARSKHWTVIYTLGAASTTADIFPAVAKLDAEPVVTGPPDKFINTNLEALLKERGIKTVVTIGSAAEGAVLHTAAAAAFRGFDVVIPVDGMASSSLYAEQYTAWDLVNAPRVSARAKLSAIGMLD